MEQFVQCVTLGLDYDEKKQLNSVREGREICINTRYVVSVKTFEELFVDGDEKKDFKYYIITMDNGEHLYVKREPHLIAIFGV